RIFPDVNLNLRPAIGQDEEIRLSEAAYAQDAPACDGIDRRRFEGGAVLSAVVVDEIADGSRPIELVAVSIHAQLCELGQMRAALEDLFVFCGHLRRDHT